MTDNQMRFLGIAAAKPNEWVDIGGVCLVGRFSARGRGFVLKSLTDRGLILEAFTPAAKYRGQSLRIQITEAGRLAFLKELVVQSECSVS